MCSFTQLCFVNRHWKGFSPCQIAWRRQKFLPVSYGQCNLRTLMVFFRLFILHLFCLAQPVHVTCHYWSSFQSSFSEDIQHNIYSMWTTKYSGATLCLNLYWIQHPSTEIMQQVNFNLRSWASNSVTLQQITTADKTINHNTTVQILGHLWNTCTDTMSLAPKTLPSSNIVSKHSVLQDSSQIFDPLGYYTKGKILLQERYAKLLCKDTTTGSMATETILGHPTSWRTHSQMAQHNYAVTFMNTLPRIYFPYLSGTINYHLCVFADASTKAYGAIAHPCSDNNISFVMFKGRVAPIKSLNLPKLELMTAVTATRVAKFVQSSFSANQHLLLVHPWMDSQIVLHWINNGSHSNSFVHQWVTETLKNFSSRCWSFTLSANNPADLPTREISTEQLKSSELWVHGPHWFLNSSNWPTWTLTNIFDVVVQCI